MKAGHHSKKNWSKLQHIRSILGILTILFSMAGCSQPQIGIDEVLPLKSYQEDLNELAGILIENHPAPYAFQSKEEFQTKIKGMISQLDDKTRLGTFIWMCKNLVASIACSHTYLDNQEERILLPPNLLFPMEVAFLQDKLIVLNPMSNKGVIPEGAEIQSINGMDISVLKKKIFSQISADGGNLEYKEALLNKNASKYIAFELKFPRRYSIESEGEIFQLKSTDVQIPYLSNITSCAEDLCLDFRKEENIAILTIRSFDYEGRQLKKFLKSIDESFQSIADRNIENLIIDLRYNRGGNPYAAAHLLGLIANDAFQYFEGEGEGFHYLRTPIFPSKKAFTGNKWILMNGSTASASGQFIAIAQENAFAKLAGTEDGSTYTNNAEQIKFSLRNTGLEGFVARTTFTAPVSTLPLDQGIKPDIEIPSTKADLLDSRDLQLETLIELVVRNKAN
jgi:C-terminal processing protease CtpA/Prc